MALPISIGECLDLIDRGLQFYKKVKHDVPELIAEIYETVEGCQLHIVRLQEFLQSDNKLVSLRPVEKQDLENIITKLKADISRVNQILYKWDSNKSVAGLQWRKWLTQTIFSLGSSPEELEKLDKKIEKRQEEIERWKSMLSLWGQTYALTVAKPSSRPPSPGQRSDYKIMFIDSDNISRSVVAEAYTLLCREWTIRTGGVWRISWIHSAGLHVKTRSNTASLQQSLGMETYSGDRPPHDIAVSALFDGLPFTYGYKDDIRKRLLQRRSRGLTENLFATYDFILVFNRHNVANLENLRDALARKHGQPAPDNRGRIVLLGEYGTSGYKEIFHARKGPDGKESIENWNSTNDNIKTSIKNFLKKEFHWSQPQAGAKQDA